MYLSAVWIGLAALGLLLILIAVSSAQAIYNYTINQQLDDARAIRVGAQKNYQALANSYPLLTIDKPLVDQVTDYETQLRQKRETFDALTHATIRRPFSTYMQTLSEIVPNGLWLTGININQDLKNISLSGFSIAPVSVSVFLQALQTQPAFKGIIFDLFYVKKVKDKDYVQFEIANETLMSDISEPEENKKPGVGN